MPNNPIQVLLNAQNFVRAAEVTPGGSNKDFFENRDADFAAHKAALQQQVRELTADVVGPGGGDSLFYARVDLQAKAWAKSHRPVAKIFPPKEMANVSGNELGSVVVELAASDLPKVVEVMEKAEEKVTKRDKNKKLVPSRERSEVGAIQGIRIYGPADRRKFSAAQALRWLSDPRTGGTYYVETFVARDTKRTEPKLQERAKTLVARFEDALEKSQLPIEWSFVQRDWLPCSLYVVKVNTEGLDESGKLEAHTRLLSLLEKQAAVKSVILPPILQAADVGGEPGAAFVVPAPQQNVSYPILGIVDTGVSNLPGLQAWSAGRTDFLDGVPQDLSHGTFIAGLAAAGTHLNPTPIFSEVGCRFFDLGLHPTVPGQYANFYPKGFLDFLEQLDAELAAMRLAGARIVNMSLAVTTPIAEDGYSIFATALDAIADRHDAIFVLPAGNLTGDLVRDPWPNEPTEALAMIAGYPHGGQDKIFQPADSIRSVVVGALDPALPGGEHYPSQYTRRGPGPALGAKPDVAHVGGRYEANTGLSSLSVDGHVIQSCGTSYAAPLVAKTLAALDHAIEGGTTREALIALLVHHAIMPTGIGSAQLKSIARDFVGAGIPALATNTLTGEDDSITLVFNGVLKAGQELSFDFAWPASLVSGDGTCAGSVTLTWAYRPPIDRLHGGEFVRVNLDAFLRQEVIDQETGEVSYKGRLKDATSKAYERELIANGAKWWPVKSISSTFPRGVGNSSQWKLVIESLCRAGCVIPDEGIPFSAILTIRDPNGVEPIFNEMRTQLQNSGVAIADIRTAARLRAARA